jgi:riboflavin kinase / FMN adenylyltransferase
MKKISFTKNVKAKAIVLALGNFDGVHVGHQRLILEALRFAKKNKFPCFAMTFDPHPQEIVNPGRGLCLLTTLSERIALMRWLGVDGVMVKEFNAQTSKLSPEKFICDFLVDHLNVRKVFVGYDFAFGHKRAGTISILKKLGAKYGFAVNAVKPVMTHGHLVKSSAIRDMIARGDFSKALKLLGHPYTLSGLVVRGRGVGNKLGFPTANLSVAPDKLIPAHGVYVGRVGRRMCVVNIGSRPTFAEYGFAIEVHIPGFHGNLRGKILHVDLFKRLRDEIHFSDVEKLKLQIRKDIEMAKIAIKRMPAAPL